jgi:hypothetical protein
MFFRQFTYNEKSYSMREKFSKGPKGPQMLAMMNTTPMEKVIPKIIEEYGKARPFDLIGSMSTSFLEPKIQGFKPSGV